MEINQEKKAVRKDVLAAVQTALSKNELMRSLYSHKACTAFIKSEIFTGADVVMSYMALKNEIDPFRILVASLNSYKKIAFPRCSKEGSSMEFYMIHGADTHVQLMEQFDRGAFGVCEPKPLRSMLLDSITLRKKSICVIVPGVAFTYRGGRLGHGKGYYDRYLTDLCDKAASHDCKLYLVGMCFDEQLKTRLPLEEHDIHMDYILTPSGLFRCNK